MANILDRQQEADWVELAQAGSAAAFGLLYDAYIKKIYDFIYYKTMHRDTAEDVTSEVFMKAWKNISQFQGGSFSAWLYTIARHAVIDHYRRHRDTVDIEDCWDLAAADDFWERLDQNLKMADLRQAMTELKSQDREIIIMRLWLDLSFKEIAEQLGKQEGAVKMSFGRALSRLKEKTPLALIMLGPEIINIWTKTN